MWRLLQAKWLFIPGVLLTLALTACSSAATPPPLFTPEPLATPWPTVPATPTPLPTPAPTAQPVPTPTPVVSAVPAGAPGGSLTIAGFADVPHRDVHQEAQETLTALGPGLAYSRLLRLRVGPEFEQPSLLLECDLCESWELNDDLSYEFRLRPGIHWQNLAPVNGRALLAEDLVYSYQRMRTPGWPNAHLFAERGIGEIEALDDTRLRVGREFLDSDALLSLADGHSKIVAREVVEEYGNLKDSPVVGTGPWVWEGTERGMGTRFTRNPDYFEAGLPFLDELEIKVFKPSGPRVSASREQVAAFQVGQVDVLTLSPEEWQKLYASNVEFNTVLSHQAGNGLLFSLNVQAPPLDDLVIRQSIFQALDPWEYVDLIWSGQGSVGVGLPVPSPEWQLPRQEMRDRFFANPSGTRDVLVSRGVPIPLDLELLVADSDEIYLELARQMAEDLGTAGFNITIRPLNPVHFGELLLGPDQDYQMALGPVPTAASTNSFLLSLLHSGGSGNLARHNDLALNALIEEQAGELDPEQRREELLAIQRHVLEQAYLFSPVSQSHRWVFGWDLRGFYPNNSLSEYIYWSRAWLEH